MAGGVHVLVPLKRFEAAKSRLASLLSPAERASLVQGMLAEVVGAVLASRRATAVTLVSSEPSAPGLARSLGIDLWDDGGRAWNDALAAASRAVVREPAAAVISADLPLLSASEVDELVGSAPARGLAVARALDGGTNAVAMRPPGVSPTCFGEPGSAERHAGLAEALGLRAVIVDRPGLAFDLDTPEDAERLLVEAGPSATRALLAGALGRVVRT